MPKKKPKRVRREPAPDPNESAYSVMQQIIRKTESEPDQREQPKKK